MANQEEKMPASYMLLLCMVVAIVSAMAFKRTFNKELDDKPPKIEIHHGNK